MKFPKPSELKKTQPKLPNPLEFLNGETVKSVEEWEKKRKPELRSLFEFYMYGKRPQPANQLSVQEVYKNEKAFDGSVTIQEFLISYNFGKAKNPAPVRLLLATPNDAKNSGPYPCFVGMAFSGIHTIVDDVKIKLPENWQYQSKDRLGVVDNKATEASRGTQKDVWPIQEICKRNFALAVFYNGDIQPDRPKEMEALRKVIIADRAEQAGQSDEGDTTATIMSWSWGASLVAYVLKDQPRIDSNNLAVVGHSRLGKAALLAGAFDERFKVVIPNQAGCGGTGPSRHSDPKAETISRINKNFPHWFCENFKEFSDDPSRLPFDQNGLVALCAPRNVLLTNAQEDLWANPDGQFEILKAAEPVYALYGLEGMPAGYLKEGVKAKLNVMIDTPLGYFIRPGQHEMNRDDWKIYLTYAEKYLKKK